MRGFYKGILSPIVGAIPFNVVVFTTKEAVFNLIGNHYPEISEEGRNFIAGSISGSVASIVYNPVDLLKMRA